MGTKNTPSKFDCYANAHPDEPMFILLGRDKHAAALVRLWAILRHRDGEDETKIEEALQCADAMAAWAHKDAKERVAHGTQFEAIFMAATEGLPDHPEDFSEPCACDECCSYQ